ncbi:MAG: hypothetical protein IIB56_03820 [Planctomycetes bacterium]|nr:hypothetical protein [Planctomycetota bacterium]MCH8120327.1 hypothetical protein [Planctomycetota bacterium]
MRKDIEEPMSEGPEQIASDLAKVVREGYKIVCSEPSAALYLKQELRHFVAGWMPGSYRKILMN